MYHPFASQSPTTSHGGTRKNDIRTTTSSPTPQCRVHVAVVDGVVLLEEARARRGSSSSSSNDDDNDDDVSSRASSVSLVSSPVKYMIAALENQRQQRQRQRCDEEDAKSNNIGGRSSLLSFDDHDSSVLNYENDNNNDDDDDDDDDEVTDVSSLQTGASVFHLPTTPPPAPAPPPSSKTAYGGIMAAATTAATTTDDREYSTEDEESTMFAMSSSACDPINIGHRTIHTMSILALTRSNDPLDYGDVVQRGGGGGNYGNTVVTTTIIGPLGDELSYYAGATSNDDQRGAGHAELLAADEEENRGRGNNNNILDDSRDDDDDDDEYDNYFGLTNLIAYSSKRVKIVLVTTVAFIVGMLVLTMVFSATASYSSDGFDGTTTVAALGESTSIVGGTEETTIALMTTDDITTTTIPTVYPSLLPSTTSLPSYTPSMSSLPTVTNLPSNIPTVTTSPSITTSPSFEPTTMLSNKNMLVLDQVDETVGGKISFYLMADGGSRIKYWSSMLANLSILNNHAFLVHLGSATRIVDNCDVNAYVRTKFLLSASPIPVYSIPGDNDYPLCHDPSAGWKLYKEHLMTIDTMYWNVTNTTSCIVNRQVPKREENFAFLYKRVLFIGLNMVNNVNDLVKTDILKDNIDWVVTNVNAYWTNVDVIFLMGYGRLLTVENVPFKDALIMKARNEWSDKLLVYARRAATTAGTTTVANVTNFIELKVAPEWPIMEVSVRTRQRGGGDDSSNNVNGDDNLPFLQYFAAPSGLKDKELV